MTRFVNRRTALVGMMFGFTLTRGTIGFASQQLPSVHAFHNPGCDCCHKWAKQMELAGFSVTLTEDPDVAAKQKALGIPEALTGCHFARVGSYLIAGHVPSEDVLRLLKEQLKVKGLTVPGMPFGSPGMETAGTAEKYAVLTFSADGTSAVFAQH